MADPFGLMQESEAGNWHVPIATDDDIETNRQWICATRASTLSTQFRVRVEQSKMHCTQG